MPKKLLSPIRKANLRFRKKILARCTGSLQEDMRHLEAAARPLRRDQSVLTTGVAQY
jgi:hypothetical protein